MWEDILKRRNAKQDAEDLIDEDFIDVAEGYYSIAISEIRRMYYKYFNEDNQEKFDLLRIKTARFLAQDNYEMTLKGVKGIKKMVNQFDLPELDYLIEMLEHRIKLYESRR
jgi:hypothetical protein